MHTDRAPGFAASPLKHFEALVQLRDTTWSQACVSDIPCHRPGGRNVTVPSGDVGAHWVPLMNVFGVPSLNPAAKEPAENALVCRHIEQQSEARDGSESFSVAILEAQLYVTPRISKKREYQRYANS